MKTIDYSLTGESARLAVANGLAEAEWYTTPVPRAEMRKLLERRDGPAIRDTLIWFGLLGLFGTLGVMLWGSWWAVLPFMAYGVIYASTSDSRWHESSHGTAFKTDWMNNVLYEIASFMVMRESTPWRWSHTRHHSDTIVVGRDPEIAAPLPVVLRNFFMVFTGIPQSRDYFKKLFKHATGKLFPDEATFIPESEHAAVFFKARVSLLIYAAVIASCFVFGTILPLMFIGLPNLYGTWLMPIYGYTQHVGLAENVLDHRKNCRTVRMNLINRYLYWNMNYHIEHHMFPLVPYHNLPKLYELVKEDYPEAYSSIWNAWKEIIPAVFRQAKDPTYFVERKLPATNRVLPDEQMGIYSRSPSASDAEGWIRVCPSDALAEEDAVRFNCGEKSFAVYRTKEGVLRATDGFCTHGRTHLAEGFVKGELIECPKHNGRFDMRDGSVQRDPVCVGLCTYEVREEQGAIWLNLESAGGEGAKLAGNTRSFRVVRNDNVATFIKELVLEPLDEEGSLAFTAGDYLQLNIPPYNRSLKDIHIEAPYAGVWESNGYFDCHVAHDSMVRRNYSLAVYPGEGAQLRFNVRFSPPVDSHQAGVGSSYVFSLKPGDVVEAIGPFGDFHIKPTEKEMVYIGGGAGMAPLRSHISHLFESVKTGRKVSFWYGARSRQELFYTDYFEKLAEVHENFSFHVALSEPLPDDNWSGPEGFIHEVVAGEYLAKHAAPGEAEYYLCGPPAMVTATQHMLLSMNVPKSQIAFDEF